MARSTRFELVRIHGAPTESTLADDVRRGFAERPRSIPPKHFYDAAGSALFDEICTLPEYYLTRAEHRLLERYARDIVAWADPAELVELGSGMARKTGLLLGVMASRVARPTYVPLDISAEALEASARTLLAAHPTLDVRAVAGDFQRDLGGLVPEAGWRQRRLFAFLGSTMGNLDEAAAPRLVHSLACCLREKDSVLLGVNLVKEKQALDAAYNDSRGVTAKFNKNVLNVVNRELHADFALADWDHVAFYDSARARVEMRLRSARAQRVVFGRIGLEVAFEAGEDIQTEISRKFTQSVVISTLALGGMRLEGWYDDGDFALALARLA